MKPVGMNSNKAADIVTLDDERRRRAADADALAGDEAVSEASAEEAVPLSDSPEDMEADKADSDSEHLETAGAMLAAARSALGLSTAEVATRTNIPEHRLIAIELMDIASLPKPPFSLGFVRTYAELLNLPADPLVDRFRAEAGYDTPGPTLHIEPKLTRDLGPPAQVSLLAVLGVVIFILWVVWKIVQALAPEQTVALERYPLSTSAPQEEAVTYEARTSLEDEVPLVPAFEEELPDLPAAEMTVEEGEISSSAPSDETASGLENEPQAVSEMPQDDGGDSVAAVQEDEIIDNSPAPEASSPSLAERLNQALLEEGEGAELDEASAMPASDAADDVEEITPQAGPIEAVPAPVIADSLDEIVIYTEPVVRMTVDPVYPQRCSNGANRVETVLVTFTVSRFGKVTNPAVTDSSNTCFNRAAIAAVSRWDFEPAMENGRAVQSRPRTSRLVFQQQ